MLARCGQSAAEFIDRHARHDWGDLCPGDHRANEVALAHEGDPDRQERVFSVYWANDNSKLFCITEWDRSYTTVLLPEEY